MFWVFYLELKKIMVPFASSSKLSNTVCWSITQNPTNYKTFFECKKNTKKHMIGECWSYTADEVKANTNILFQEFFAPLLYMNRDTSQTQM